MLEVVRAIESCNVVFGLLLNSLLLFLIFKCSKPQLGNYRHLLKIFASNDIFLVFLHATVQPTSFTGGSALAIFSRTFPDDKQLMIASAGCMTVPFTLMNINFLHRYLSVKKPHTIRLFSKPSFSLFLSLYPITIAVLWYFAAGTLVGNAAGKEILQRWISVLGGVTIGEGWMILHFWENGKLHIPGIITHLCGGSIILFNLMIAGALCTLTIRHLRTESTFFPSYKVYQFKILRALFAQSAIPIFLMYIPTGVGMTIPLFIDFEPKSGFDPWFILISSFPAIDAVVIILLMRDYRDGLIAMIRRLSPTAIDISSSSTTHISTIKT